MGNIVGIDLGTTNSVAAFKFAEAQVVDDPKHGTLVRSVVSFSNNSLIVGKEAYNQLLQDPENVIISIKRLMGRGFGDDVVQQQLKNFGYKITQSSEGTENSLSVWLGGKEYQPEDISAEILKQVVENAQAYQENMGQTGNITKAVITIPAYFNDKQRYTTEIASVRAGLGKPVLLPEPTAAAISYGFKPNSDDVKTILVYDFGGGTFDSSLITTAGSHFIESGKAGDLWLGGDDIDNKLAELVKQKVAKEEGLDSIDTLIANMPYYQQVRFKADLKIATERAKIDLSSKTEAKVNPSTPLLDEFGMAIPIDITITRKEFEAMILPLVKRSIEICHDAIKYSDYPTDMIDIVLMVGGSSQIPLVQEEVKKAFGNDKVVVHPRPMYAVAEGAGIVSAGVTEVVGTVSRDYCIQLVDDPRYQLIKQGEVLPIQKNHTFKTEGEGQELIHFKFFSPDEVREGIDLRKNDERIGDMWLALDKPYPRGTEVDVMVELDEQNSALTMTACLKNNPSIRVSGSFSRGNHDEQINQKVEELIHKLNQEGNLTEYGVQNANELAGEIVRASNQIYLNGVLQRDRQQVAEEKLKELEAFACGDRDTILMYLRDFNFALEFCSHIMHEDQVNRLKILVSEMQNAVDSNNISAMQRLAEDGSREFDNLPDLVRILLLIRFGVARACRIAPSHGKVLETKFINLLDAMERGDGNTSDRLYRELLEEIREYIDQDLPTGVVATGLTR
ncbi:Hsp70 family protein [Cyanobacterium aponinum UTEX 3222]|uniref:Hsp70 family protein n=1 Tax=Cyanobacterium aponinum 0216 TaxID=2676140 RepID=A0A844GUW0_9CHRO|nr:Hsp70 family protein [Cyanobacterium aponinum]MBD2394155.1 Hsp70 family protein [Cyanobacterium aponinum FACHB-4101]MTF38638.1 Hsp70 family protein [Cyanobacterium aponinum 0216]WRL42095.1 Hsp70 family protein [Cyanobacterium aponinum UTEX 3222]